MQATEVVARERVVPASEREAAQREQADSTMAEWAVMSKGRQCREGVGGCKGLAAAHMRKKKNLGAIWSLQTATGILA
jgi:hypothetical protein